jgi:hypothetical protein
LASASKAACTGRGSRMLITPLAVWPAGSRPPATRAPSAAAVSGRRRRW